MPFKRIQVRRTRNGERNWTPTCSRTGQNHHHKNVIGECIMNLLNESWTPYNKAAFIQVPEDKNTSNNPEVSLSASLLLRGYDTMGWKDVSEATFPPDCAHCLASQTQGVTQRNDTFWTCKVTRWSYTGHWQAGNIFEFRLRPRWALYVVLCTNVQFWEGRK